VGVKVLDTWEREIVSSILYLARAASEGVLMRAVVEHHTYLRKRGGYLRKRGGYCIVKLAICTSEVWISRQ